jgi:hypothetical protein
MPHDTSLTGLVEQAPPVFLVPGIEWYPLRHILPTGEQGESQIAILTPTEHIQLSDAVSIRLSQPFASFGSVLGSTQEGHSGARLALQIDTTTLVATTLQQLGVGRMSDSAELAKDVLKSRIRVVLTDAEHEELEIGVQSTFSRRLLALVAEHGKRAVEALNELMGILLRELGRVRDESSRQVRRKLLSDLLRSRYVQVRHASATGLAELDDPEAIPALETAIDRERFDAPREHLALVLDQLRDTQRWLGTS